MKTQIKDIPNWPGYQATNDGHIISYKYKKPRVLKPNKTNRGYLYIVLCDNGKPKTIMVHTIIALVFHGARPHGMTINHKNGNKIDNKALNLEYISLRENVTHYQLKQQTTSQFVGVHWDKHAQKYMARFSIGKKKYHIGCFNTELEASNAYQQALNKLKA